MDNTQTQNNTGTDKDALNLTHAIALSETGDNGKPNYNAVGASGEKGAYQWMPGNYEKDAQDAGFDPSDFSPATQDKVAYAKIKKLKDQGYDPGQIASLWNSGDPNNWQNHSGVNQYGVAYDTPGYVQKVKQNYQKIIGGYNPTPYSNNQTSGDDTQDNQNQPDNALTSVLKFGNFLFPIAGDIYNDFTGKNNKTALQQTGDLALSALPFIPGLGEVGEGAKAGVRAAELGTELAGQGAEQVAKTGLSKFIANPIVKNAAVGYGAGIANNLSQGKSIGESVGPNVNTLGGAVLGGGTSALLDNLGGIRTSLSGIDPQIENELKDYALEKNPENLAQYNKYINATKDFNQHLRGTSAYTTAANSLDDAALKVTEARKAAGSIIGQIKNSPVGSQPLQDITPVIDNFNKQLEETFGRRFEYDENGNLVQKNISGRNVKLSSKDEDRLAEIFNTLNKLKTGTIAQASDEAGNLSNLIDYSNKDDYGVTTDPLKSLIKTTDGGIRNTINQTSPELAQANANFSGYKNLENEIANMAGNKLDRGELLMRRVFSGDKSGDVQDLFGKIKDATGVDLIKDAVFAKHAINSVGSDAQKTLFEKIIGKEGNISGGGGSLGMLINGGKYLAKKTLANPEGIGRELVTGKNVGLIGNIGKDIARKGAIKTGSSLGK